MVGRKAIVRTECFKNYYHGWLDGCKSHLRIDYCKNRGWLDGRKSNCKNWIFRHTGRPQLQAPHMSTRQSLFLRKNHQGWEGSTTREWTGKMVKKRHTALKVISKTRTWASIRHLGPSWPSSTWPWTTLSRQPIHPFINGSLLHNITNSE